MTTPRDLMFVALDAASGRPPGQGELSLALAGAELIDLLAAGTVELDGHHIVPAGGAAPDDALLRAAASGVVREEPYESVDDWLWRRGRELSPAYQAALEAEGLLTRQRGRRLPFRAAGEPTLAESPDRRRAADRLTAEEPVLTALAAAVRLDEADAPDDLTETDGSDGVTDAAGTADLPDGVEAVLAALGDAELELAAARQRRDVEQAAFDNIWRAV
ncbi:GPP34 family phosphoprotein [Streptomyces venezuelae]|uniref:GOLPH3/VPS74 family protein n=1 Tax=Streptomyces venezuelae TaxID=54571 RepID=UPI00123D96C8|nr:GPP34 family phosphoprotein [Streptomyces venezuelae]QES11266.1 GPP34 family phosphoprotein [Streptomyces venezuelae]